MSEFNREERYVVFKLEHMDDEQIEFLDRVRRELPDTVDCVVVESHWPEYSKVWQMIEDRVEGEKR